MIKGCFNCRHKYHGADEEPCASCLGLINPNKWEWPADTIIAPMRHGHWIPQDAECEYRCSLCGKIVFADDSNELNYCCNCGAKMGDD